MSSFSFPSPLAVACIFSTVGIEACPRPDGCFEKHNTYTTIDCDGDGVDDHVCQTSRNSKLWIILSTEGCPQHSDSWGRFDRAMSECPPIQSKATYSKEEDKKLRGWKTKKSPGGDNSNSSDRNADSQSGGLIGSEVVMIIVVSISIPIAVLCAIPIIKKMYKFQRRLSTGRKADTAAARAVGGHLNKEDAAKKIQSVHRGNRDRKRVNTIKATKFDGFEGEIESEGKAPLVRGTSPRLSQQGSPRLSQRGSPRLSQQGSPRERRRIEEFAPERSPRLSQRGSPRERRHIEPGHVAPSPRPRRGSEEILYSSPRVSEPASQTELSPRMKRGAQDAQTVTIRPNRIRSPKTSPRPNRMSSKDQTSPRPESEDTGTSPRQPDAKAMRLSPRERRGSKGTTGATRDGWTNDFAVCDMSCVPTCDNELPCIQPGSGGKMFSPLVIKGRHEDTTSGAKDSRVLQPKSDISPRLLSPTLSAKYPYEEKISSRQGSKESTSPRLPSSRDTTGVKANASPRRVSKEKPSPRQVEMSPRERRRSKEVSPEKASPRLQVGSDATGVEVKPKVSPRSRRRSKESDPTVTLFIPSSGPSRRASNAV